MRNGGLIMKKIFSSAFSLLTSVALLVGAAPSVSFAEDSNTNFIDIDDCHMVCHSCALAVDSTSEFKIVIPRVKGETTEMEDLVGRKLIGRYNS